MTTGYPGCPIGVTLGSPGGDEAGLGWQGGQRRRVLPCVRATEVSWQKQPLSPFPFPTAQRRVLQCIGT